MIVITGGTGFIGSALVWKLNEAGIEDVIVVDRWGEGQKWLNLRKRTFEDFIPQEEIWSWLEEKGKKVKAIFHMGACSSTTEINADFLWQNNVVYSQRLFKFATERSIPFIYASSAATYGSMEQGFLDDKKFINTLLPINKYGYSKQLFDSWVLRQKNRPPFWAGFKFFNVYGPQEYHKGGQASVVFHAFPQVKNNKKLRLFKSERSDIGHGEQKRDFVYVKDVVDVMRHALQHADDATSGIYNLGSGKARSFADLGRAVFAALGNGPANFEWIDMPESLRGQYQYFTEASLDNLRQNLGYEAPMTSLEAGVKEYVTQYLNTADPYL